MKSKLAFFLGVIWIVVGSGCKKEEDTVPNVAVNIYLQTTDPDFNDLNAVGGWIYLTGGSRGILVYRFSMEEFKAFDRHCTYDPSSTCGVISVDQSGIIAVDSCCNSKFLITDGSVLEGPASLPLKPYQTYFDGVSLRIYN